MTQSSSLITCGKRFWNPGPELSRRVKLLDLWRLEESRRDTPSTDDLRREGGVWTLTVGERSDLRLHMSRPHAAIARRPLSSILLRCSAADSVSAATSFRATGIGAWRLRK